MTMFHIKWLILALILLTWARACYVEFRERDAASNIRMGVATFLTVMLVVVWYFSFTW